MLVLNPGGAAAAAAGAAPVPATASGGGRRGPCTRSRRQRPESAGARRQSAAGPGRAPAPYLQPPDLGQLRERLAQAVRTFETEAREAGVPVESIAAARYALCTLLDEAIAGTAWGSGVWGSRSLLVAFHNEASGGEKFFLVLQRLSEDPARHLDLLELMYLCLALGLEGRFRLADQGQAQLATLRERLLQLIRQHRGPVETGPVAALARRGRTGRLAAAAHAAVGARRHRLRPAGGGAAGWLDFLNRASDPVFAKLSALRQEGAARSCASAGAGPALEDRGLPGAGSRQGPGDGDGERRPHHHHHARRRHVRLRQRRGEPAT
jgi:type VI secretion system protein ImpK